MIFIHIQCSNTTRRKTHTLVRQGVYYHLMAGGTGIVKEEKDESQDHTSLSGTRLQTVKPAHKERNVPTVNIMDDI